MDSKRFSTFHGWFSTRLAPYLAVSILFLFAVFLTGFKFTPSGIKAGAAAGKGKEEVAPQEETYYPAPQIFKYITLPTGIDCLRVSEEFRVSVEVHGDSRIMDVPIPMDVVFLLDQSGSMEGNDPNNVRLVAVETFINLMKDPSRGGRDKAAIIEFGSNAQGLYPGTSAGVAPGLSNNYDAMISALEAKNLNCTNIEQAMKLANETLVQYGTNPTRLVVLLTDGCPMTEVPDSGCWQDYQQQETIVSEHVPRAVQNDIRYYSVGLGRIEDLCPSLIRDLIAVPTHGQFHHATNPNQLPGFFSEIYENESRRMTTQDIIVEERLVQGFKYKPGSFDHSSGILPPSDAELAQFANQGMINLKMGQVLEDQQESFSFIVSCEECVQPVMPNEVLSEDELRVTLPVDKDTSRVVYQLGDGVERYLPFPLRTVCVERPGGPTIEKGFDDIKKEVMIRVKSNYLRSHPEHVIKDVHVWEVLSKYFEAARQPFSESLSAFSIPPDEVMGTGIVAGKPWGFYYHWAVGDLAPQQEWVVRLKVRSGACEPRDMRPLIVDSGKPRSYVTMILPTTDSPVEFEIPQALTAADFPVPGCPAPSGFLNFSIEPTLLTGEGGPDDPPFSKEQTRDVWIDSPRNHFVEDWANLDQIRTAIKYRVDYGNRVVPIMQGDLLEVDKENRIYLHYAHSGAAPIQRVTFALFAWPKFELVEWEKTRPILVSDLNLDPSTAVSGMYRDLVRRGPYVVFKWKPTIAQLRQAFISQPIPVSLKLERVKLLVVIKPGSGEEVFMNDNMAVELVPEVTMP
jgi:uncharacterized protein YegL